MKRTHRVIRPVDIFRALNTIDRLKHVQRAVWLGATRQENSAEHSWNVAMLVLLLQDVLPKKLNIEKMLKMALLHDLVEIYANDTPAFDARAKRSQKKRERKALRRLIRELPPTIGRDLGRLYRDFETRRSPEARYVQSVDKLLPIVHNLSSSGRSWKKYGVTWRAVDGYKRKHMEHDPFMAELYDYLMRLVRRRKLLRPG